MQGVGPRPTMANAFGDQPQQPQKKEGPEDQVGSNFDPNKTNPLSSDSPNVVARAANKAANQAQIKQISHQQQAQMQSQGWKFDRQPDGNWSASPPKSGGSQSSAQKQESKKPKKR